MNCLSRIPSYAALVLHRSNVRHIASFTTFIPPANWVHDPAASDSAPGKGWLRFYSQCTKKGRPKATIAKSKPKTAEAKPLDVDREKDVFFVVRKGDIVGVYRSFSDCMAQFGSSIHDPPVSILKGRDLPAESDNYILSRGLKSAIYTMDAADLKDDLFGMLIRCPIVEPASYKVDSSQDDNKGSVEVSSDSLVQGLWKARHKELAKLFQVVKALEQNFLSFEINHVLRGVNTEADSLANKGIKLGGKCRWPNRRGAHTAELISRSQVLLMLPPGHALGTKKYHAAMARKDGFFKHYFTCSNNLSTDPYESDVQCKNTRGRIRIGVSGQRIDQWTRMKTWLHPSDGGRTVVEPCLESSVYREFLLMSVCSALVTSL